MLPLEALKKYFGHKSFRFSQEKIINAILNSENVLAVLPTGAGKSICYQIPALISENFSIVISPLIALMKDQVDSLNKKENVAVFINSTIEYYEIEKILNEISYNKYKILYLAPERLENINFVERIKKLNPTFLFVDEAHCISEWGHNFRPSYRKIKDFIDYLGIKNVSAFTATATPEVIKDIVEQLKLKEPKIFVEGFERENLHLNVIQIKNKKEKVVELIRRYKTPAIIYTSSRKNAEEVSEYLQLNKIKSAFYHAGMNSIERKHTQEDFINDKISVIVATNAFGMGIDKKDIRMVIHYNIPSSIENYYQEIGRAGRDGKDSYIFLLFDPNDIKIQQYFISNSYPDQELIIKIYNGICNFANVAIGSKTDKDILINSDYLSVICNREISRGLLNASLKILEDGGYIKILSEFDKKYFLNFNLSPQKLRELTKNIKDEFKQKVILLLIREYGSALFNSRTKISLQDIAAELDSSEEEVNDVLISLQKSGIATYEKPSEKDAIKLTQTRVKHLNLDYKKINDKYFNAQKKLEQMIDYVYTNDCRFKYILKYFGEDVSNYSCNKCDHCNNENQLPEASVQYLQEIILLTIYEYIESGEEGIKETDLINTLIGKTKSEKLRKISTFNVCVNHSKSDLLNVIQYLFSHSLIKRDLFSGHKLLLTNKGKDFLLKQNLITEKTEQNNYEENIELYHLLKEVRAKAANKFNQPKYLICSDEVLRKIAMNKPQSIAELLSINGFNERMFNKIGEELLQTINDFIVSPNNISQNENNIKKKLPSNLEETYNLLLKGYSLNEISELLKQPPAIISMQIETIIEYYPETDISKLFDENIFNQILDEINKGCLNLKELKQRLSSSISYPQIRIALAKYKSKNKTKI